jgi:DNA ligase (NAD+)
MLKNEREIIDYLKSCDNEYYNTDDPSLNDFDYDKLKTKAKELYPDNPYFYTVGSDVKGSKVKLPYVLGSLNKIKYDTVSKWVKIDERYVISEKLDGVSFICTWIDGRVMFASTRGDGIYGQDITEKAKIFVPDIPDTRPTTLRGELTLVGNSHEKLGYKNRRNGVMGIIGKDEINVDKLQYIVPCFYEYVSGPEIFCTESLRLAWITEVLKLKTAQYFIASFVNGDFLEKKLREFKEIANYDIDGLVLTVNNSEREDVEYPKNKIAFKVNEDSVEAKVTGIEWNVSRNGKIIPVVLVEPIDIGGVTVKRATGFNFKYIKDNVIDKGAEIGLIRSGDVIPYITEVFKQANIVNLPVVCPHCKGEVKDIGVDRCCMNKECGRKMSKEVAHFFKRMGSEYVTEKTINSLGVSTIEEMYELEDLDIVGIEGFGLKRAEQIVYEIQKTLKTTPETLLAAFGMPSIGRRLSKEITKKFTFDTLFDITKEQIGQVLGSKTSVKFLDNICNFKSLYEYLKTKGLTFKIEGGNDKMFDNKKFALTGKAPMKRDLIVSLIEKSGGSVGTVSKITDYLVTADPDSTSGKTKKARDYGTEIISYDKLFEMLGE